MTGGPGGLISDSSRSSGLSRARVLIGREVMAWKRLGAATRTQTLPPAMKEERYAKIHIYH